MYRGLVVPLGLVQPVASTGGRAAAEGPAIRLEGVTFRHGHTAILHDVSFAVYPGEVVALLGPNGAGKTTTMRIVAGFAQPESGSVEVLGAVPDLRRTEHRRSVGMMSQGSAFDPFLKVGEAVQQRADLFRDGRDPAECLDLVGLAGLVDRFPAGLSGGEQRRFDLALAIAGRPQVLILDEPTTGLDPDARRRTWSLITNLKSQGVAMLLTSHYLDEAEAVADRVYLLQRGRITHSATPAELGVSDRYRIHLPLVDAPAQGQLPIGGTIVDGAFVAEVSDVRPALEELLAWSSGVGVRLDGLTVSARSLEERYLEALRPDSGVDHGAEGEAGHG